MCVKVVTTNEVEIQVLFQCVCVCMFVYMCVCVCVWGLSMVVPFVCNISELETNFVCVFSYVNNKRYPYLLVKVYRVIQNSKSA